MKFDVGVLDAVILVICYLCIFTKRTLHYLVQNFKYIIITGPYVFKLMISVIFHLNLLPKPKLPF